jgi:hypothetical protein
VILHAGSIFAARFEEGGANLTHYVNSPGLAKMIQERSWTWIVLQEQSQTPGYCEGKPEWQGVWNASLASVLQLNDMIQINGATTILLETWGYFEKDPYNEVFYPDYPTMQERLSHGYSIYHDQILAYNPDAKVKVAPVGSAFQRIYDSIQEKGDDPHAVDSLFEKLYMMQNEFDDDDGKVARKYTSLEGSYLSGCVLLQTLTGLDVRQSTYTPTGMDIQMRKILQNMAYNTVVSFQNGGSSHATSESTYEYKSATPSVPDEECVAYTSKCASTAWNWILAIGFIIAGVVYYFDVAGERARGGLPTGAGSQGHGWNPISHDDDDAMELTDIPSGNPDRSSA